MRSMIYIAPIIDRTLEPRVTQSLACAPAGRADVATDPFSWSTVSRALSETNQANELHGYISTEPQEVASADHSNQQYSITAVTTSAGAIAERYAYSAYGEPTICDASGSTLSSSAINNRYSYTGREWDATVGLHHFRARWMSPKTGRFLGRDPIGYEGSEWNLFEYVNGGALTDRDSMGTVAHGVVAGIAAAVVACVTPFYLSGLGIPDENARHCWTACQSSAACGAVLTQLLGFGFEVATGAIELAVHGNTDLKNHILDLRNNARGSYCAGAAGIIPVVGGAIGWAQWCVGRGCSACCGV